MYKPKKAIWQLGTKIWEYFFQIKHPYPRPGTIAWQLDLESKKIQKKNSYNSSLFKNIVFGFVKQFGKLYISKIKLIGFKLYIYESYMYLQ